MANVKSDRHSDVRPSRPGWSLWAMAAGMAFSATAAAAPAPSATEVPPLPPNLTYQKVKCEQKLAPSSATWCAKVAVPLVHKNPTGPSIQIYVTVLPAQTPSPGSAPLVYLTGGPGASTMDAKVLFENPGNSPDIAFYRQTFGDKRDIVIVDQRGTNASEPALYCSQELAPARSKAYGMSLTKATAMRVDLMKQCYTRLAAKTDLNAFNIYEVAADVRDVMAAIGYKKVRLYGASAGTRLVMETMKLFPDLAESAVIDSVVPPEVNPFEAQPNGVVYALGGLWNATAKQFPKLRETFYATIQDLNAHPVQVTIQPQGQPVAAAGTAKKKNTPLSPPQLFERIAAQLSEKVHPVYKVVRSVPSDGQAFTVTVGPGEYISYVVDQLRQTPYDADLPAYMMKLATDRSPQNYMAVAQAYVGTINFLFSQGNGDVGATAFGMTESVNGSADGSDTSIARITDLINHYYQDPLMRQWAADDLIYQNVDLIPGVWPVKALPRGWNYPLFTSTPTLYLVGSLDSGTPVIFAQPSSLFLTSAFLFDILAGHAVTYLQCACNLMDAFLLNPGQKPQNTCPMVPSWTPGPTPPAH